MMMYENKTQDETLNPQIVTPSSRRTLIYVTGFGPFQGVSSNPTTLLVTKLRDSYYQDSHNANSVVNNSGNGCSSSLAPPSIELKTFVLEVSATYVTKELDKIYEQINDEIRKANTNERAGDSRSSRIQQAVVLHLGVSRAKEIAIEHCAYNEANFRFPDESGYCPKNESIIQNRQDLPLGSCITTKFNVHDLCQTLQDNNEQRLHVSDNPGRFVCNYTYFYSLLKSQEMNDAMMTMTTPVVTGDDDVKMKKTFVKTLFVHVPSFDVINENDQYEFVLKLIRVVAQQQ